MNKLKVMHFIYGLNTGGAETLVKNYILNFDGHKFDVILLCLDHEKNSLYEIVLRDNKIRMIFVQDYLLFKVQNNFFKKVINYLSKYIIMKRIVRRESPNILHMHLFSNRLVRFAKPSHDVRIFYTVHNDPKKAWDRKDRRKDFQALKWLVKHYNMRFIVLHEQMKEEIKKMFGVPDSILLNNGVDVNRIKNARDGKKMQQEISIPEDAFVIGHVGRFSKVKNQEFLVDIFSAIAKKNKKAFLLMIGDGADKNKIIKKLDKNNLEGRYLILSNRNDVPELLSVMDVFVFPSLYEGLPLSLVEAQIARKPCFISDKINEHVDISNLVTRLSLKQSPEEWGNTILSYKKPKKIEVDEDSWDIKKITKQLEQIYLDALEEKKNGKK